MNDFLADPIDNPPAPADKAPERGLLASFAGICLLAVGAASLSLGVTAADLPSTPLSGHWHLRAPHGGVGPMQTMLGDATVSNGEAAAAGRAIDTDAESMPIDAVMALLQKT